MPRWPGLPQAAIALETTLLGRCHKQCWEQIEEDAPRIKLEVFEFS